MLTIKQRATIHGLKENNFSLAKAYASVTGTNYNSSHVLSSNLLKNQEFREYLIGYLYSLNVDTPEKELLIIKILKKELQYAS